MPRLRWTLSWWMFVGPVVAALLAEPALASGIWVEAPPDVRIPDEPVRLVSHRVTAVIGDHLASVTVEQTFRSDFAGVLEGTYLFPVPDSASVSRFAMTVGERTLEGEVLDAAKAREVYEKIVRARRDPGLLEWMGRGLLRARVFPIESGKDVTVRLRYEQVLETTASLTRWSYPLATTRLHPRAPEQTVIDASIESASAIQAIYSPSHDVDVARDGPTRARAVYEGADGKRDRDFTLYVGHGEGEVGFALLSHKPADEDGTFLALVSPSALVPSERLVPRDVVFVLDTSGSMEGEKLAQAKDALVDGLGSLRPEDRFALLSFATGVYEFRPGLQEASPRQRTAAGAWIRSLRAAGGTDIGGALDHALRRLEPGRMGFVVLLTDGRPNIGNVLPEKILAGVARVNGAKARVCTFGLGYDLDVGLLDRIAEATEGSRDYVAPQEDVRTATGRFYRRVDRPVWTDVDLEIPAGVYDVVPPRLGDLYAGEQVVLLGRYREAGSATFRLKGRGGANDNLAVAFEGVLERSASLDVLPRLWAQRKVAYLLDAIRLHGSSDELVDEIRTLATRYAIVTPFTAALVVEDSRPRVASANPLLGIGAGGSVPPGLRPPVDPTPPPPPPTTPFAPPSGGPTPRSSGAPPTTPTRPMNPVEESKRLREARQRAQADRDAAVVGSVREVAGKRFRLEKDGRWVDMAYDGKATSRKVIAFSDEWLALSRREARIARWLALADRLVFVLDDVAYEVVRAEK